MSENKELINEEFYDKVTQVFKDGLKEGRQPGDWKTSDKDYLAALKRHLEKKDWAAVAANCMILDWQEKPENKRDSFLKYRVASFECSNCKTKKLNPDWRFVGLNNENTLALNCCVICNKIIAVVFDVNDDALDEGQES